MNRVHLASPADGAHYRDLIDRYGSPLLVLDNEEVRRRYSALSTALPDVALYFAVKSLPSPDLIATLSALGAGFDLASAGEAALVQSVGITPDRTIHTHPIKSDAEIRAALRFGCTTFVVDNAFEIQKFVRYRHRVGLLLRVGFRGASARVDLSRKFGCAPDLVPELLTQARELGLRVKGFSFHVGSQATDPTNHADAVRLCARLLEESESRVDTPMSVLDIGGGFPVPCALEGRWGEPPLLIEEYCAPIRDALATLPTDLQVIAEPGRYLSAPAVSLICSVIGKAPRGGQMWFYLDEGVYGSFSGQVYDHASYPLTVFAGEAAHARGVLAGPTCDSVDVVAEDVPLPDLGIGDIVVAHQMGAYTMASATEFNSLPRTRLVVLDAAPAQEALSA